MTVNLRDYQQAATDAAIDWIKKSTEPCLLELCTGAGKSLIVAAIAKWIHEKSGKKIVCFAPGKELLEQNGEKMGLYGYQYSFYCAALEKSMRHDIIFATPDTVKNSINLFRKNIAAVIIDEAHRLTPTMLSILEDMIKHNENLRIIGMTATPYRTGEGYIFRYWADGKPVDEDQTIEPFFHSLVYRTTAHELIARGYLTTPHADPAVIEQYDTSGIKRHSVSEYEKAFEGKGRKTARIVADIIAKSAGRNGVMIFAATVKHAMEVMESLPPEISRVVSGETSKAERAQIVADFKAQKFKYLVNVAVFTTGFDATHVDVVAIMRSTDSASLLQQIIGRGLRLHPGKRDCLILDYAENIERHQLEDDLFTPSIKAKKKQKGEPINVVCPLCSFINEFGMRPNPDEFEWSEDGYFLDLAGQKTEMPSHWGRRCFGYSLVNGKAERCEHRWSVKVCDECGHENDIAARYCEKCKTEIVDPNEKLREEFARIKRDPKAVSTDRVTGFSLVKHVGQKSGTLMLKATYSTEYRKTIEVYYNPEGKGRVRNAYEQFSKAFYNGRVAPTVDDFMNYRHHGAQPQTITYAKEGGYWRIYDYNKPEDVPPILEAVEDEIS